MTRVQGATAESTEAAKRRYDSPVRRAQAAATRAAIVEAAARTFSERGFEKTPVSLIAREAHFSVQTLYDSVGGKRELLLAVLDRIDESHFPPLVAELESCIDPAEMVKTWVGGLRRYVEENANLVRAALAAGDEDTRAMVAEGHARHLAGAERLVRAVGAAADLPENRLPREVAIEVAMVTAPGSWYFVVDTAGATWDEAEALLRRSVARLLVSTGEAKATCH